MRQGQGEPRRRWVGAAAIGLVLLLAAPAAHPDDTVVAKNHPGTGVGLLLDGLRVIPQLPGRPVFVHVNDWVTVGSHSPWSEFTAPGPPLLATPLLIDVGDMRFGSHGRNELIGFARDRAPKLVPFNWSNGNDAVSLTFGPPRAVNVVFWVVTGDYGSDTFLGRRFEAIKSLQYAEDVFREERAGLVVRSVGVHDAIVDCSTSPHCQFLPDEETDAPWRRLRAEIGFQEDALNVYLIDKVWSKVDAGFIPNYGYSNAFVTERPNVHMIVLGNRVGEDLLVHEMGHSLSLRHGQWGREDYHYWNNIMHRASLHRKYITEGQSFRAHLYSRSIVNTMMEPAERLRDCEHADTRPDMCPLIDLRIWRDPLALGTYAELLP